VPAHGLGLHFWTLTASQTINYFKYVWATNLCYTAGTTLIKLAILFQYLRLFDIMHSRLARTVTQITILLTALWGTGFTLLALFACRPIAKNWNFLLPGKCVAWGSKDANTFFAWWAAHAATNMFFDILVFVLPIPFLKGLRLQGKTRIGLFGLFTMGGVVVSLSIARMVSISIKRAGTVPIFDPTFATPLVYISSVLEINMTILCASIPIFWPLVVEGWRGKGILVVNEIEIRTDSYSSAALDVGLAEQGANVGTVGVPGLEMEMNDGRTSRMSAMAYGREKEMGGGGFLLSRSGSMLMRSGSKKHRSRPSVSSVHTRSASIGLGRRVSQESQCGLNLHHQPSEGTLSLSSSKSSPPSGPSPLERSLSRYQQDRYVLIPPDRSRKAEK
jgi:hypothetical protein